MVKYLFDGDISFQIESALKTFFFFVLLYTKGNEFYSIAKRKKSVKLFKSDFKSSVRSQMFHLLKRQVCLPGPPAGGSSRQSPRTPSRSRDKDYIKKHTSYLSINQYLCFMLKLS